MSTNLPISLAPGSDVALAIGQLYPLLKNIISQGNNVTVKPEDSTHRIVISAGGGGISNTSALALLRQLLSDWQIGDKLTRTFTASLSASTNEAFVATQQTANNGATAYISIDKDSDATQIGEIEVGDIVRITTSSSEIISDIRAKADETDGLSTRLWFASPLVSSGLDSNGRPTPYAGESVSIRISRPGTVEIEDRSITLSKLSTGTSGKFIGYDDQGDPAELDVPSFDHDQSDWLEGDSNSEAYIKNKPTVISNAERLKLASIHPGAEVNTQSDWAVTDNTDERFIRNKPDLTNLQPDWDESDSSQPDFIRNKPATITQAERNKLAGLSPGGGGAIVSATAPDNPTEGMFWYDIS